MKHDLMKIIKKNNVHSTILNEKGIVSAMEESYNLGVNDVLDWLSKMDYLSNNIEYLIEEWNNQQK